MFEWPAITAVCSASMVGVAIPGANFVAIANRALRSSRLQALGMSCGFAVVNSLWAVIGILGAGTAVAHHAWLGLALQMAGCTYLIWFGARLLLRPASLPPPGTPSGHDASAFRQGVALNITNPKSLLFYCAFLSNLVPAAANAPTVALMVLAVGGCAVLWYGSLGWLLSRPGVALRLGRHLGRINAGCGVLLMAAGLFELMNR
ncbi:LysE family translocator [Herbaspirillum sp. YR522]|uniref:LysE family translocator n=1 Tax=Herbaspirillum sp. YR522 TaxID=1144342 RepID=UPI0003115B5B|nr:LysE family translocator [Herbaspirillum sp. YR522]